MDRRQLRRSRSAPIWPSSALELSFLAARPLVRQVCRGLNIPITITRQVLGWVQPPTRGLFDLGSFPCWAVERDDGRPVLRLSELPWHPGFKLALHAKGQTCDPDTVNRTPGPSDESRVPRRPPPPLARRERSLLSMGVMHVRQLPDSHFIVDRHPAHPNVIVATGFSGPRFQVCPRHRRSPRRPGPRRHNTTPDQFLGLSRFRR
jgi:hypothetical protein